MIDTDKYEGHTPAPWVIEEGDMEYGETDTVIAVAPPNELDVVANGIMRQDAQLIADAPLLLAEVKRLRDIVCLLEDSRIRGLSIFDRPQLFDDVLQIHTQRNEQGNGDLPPFECVGEEE